MAVGQFVRVKVRMEDGRPRPSHTRTLLEAQMAKSPTVRNFLDALAAVLAGNAIYFMLMPHLPRVMRHSLFKEDWGLLVDFATCTIVFLAVKIARQ
ncbi:MAG: hypothetical protein WA172_17115 [Terriglobales bacterium]